MPDGPRLCPSCGRRVPRAVSTCRCGAAIPAAVEAVVVPAAEAESAGYTVPAVAAVALILAAAGAWFLLRPAAPTEPPDRVPAVSERAPASAPAATAELSPERRAWDATAAGAGLAPSPTAAPAPTPASEPPAPADIPAGLEDIVGRVMPAVVRVEASGGTGSGFYVRTDTVITNVHVVGEDLHVMLRQLDGSSVRARVDSRSPAYDIAVLKVATPSLGQVVIPLGSYKSLRPGQEVMAIGSALGTLQNSVTRGIVSGVRESGGATLVQTDTAANPGNSGGPLLDRTGTAIGIITLGIIGRQGLNFAVAIDHARDILEGRRVATAGALTLEGLGTPANGSRSEAQRIQEDGARQFMAATEGLTRAADSLDTAWKRFRESCYSGGITGSFDREWFAVLSPRAMAAPVPAQCSGYFSNFKTEADRFNGLMRKALDDARRAGVLPGEVRDTLREHRLQFEGWDR